MSYLVLARKYRPKSFAEVVGQEHVTRTLGNAFATGRVHHAFLFCGPRGCGKTTLARIVGKALNCERRAEGATAEPCGECAACVSIGNGSAVDYQEMDGASNRGIDAIRELTEAVRYQPAVLRKKVYVIDEVHMLTTEAFNALLKTLEEPPPHVTFVLATTEPHKLPNTILSRCQRYDFKLVPASRLAQHLTSIFAKEQLQIEPGAVSLVVRESGGSVRDALSLCDQLISYVGDAVMTERHVAEVLGVADRSLTRTLVRALASGDAGEALGSVESAIERGVDEVQLARAIVRYLRDLSVLQVAPNRRGLIDATDEELAELAREASSLPRSRITQMFERMLRCCDELGKTLQPRLVLDCALIDVATIEPLVPLGDLIDRLTDLEGRIAGRAGRPVGGGGGGTQRAPARALAGPAPSPSRAPYRSDGGPSEPARVDANDIPRGGLSEALRNELARSEPPRGAPPRNEPMRNEPMRNEPSRNEPPQRSEPMRNDGPRNEPSRGEPPSRMNDGARNEPPPWMNEGPRNEGPRGEPSRNDGPRSDPRNEPARSASMQPSGAVPRLDASASGSGPHEPPRQGNRPSGPEPARLSVPSNETEALRAWGDVLSELETLRKFTLLGPFQHARIMAWTTEVLDLGFPLEDHAMGEMAKDRVDDLRAVIRGMSPDLKNLQIKTRMLDASESSTAGPRSVLETTRERSSAERTKREAEARAHPITKHVLQTFGAQIKEIKTDV